MASSSVSTQEPIRRAADLDEELGRYLARCVFTLGLRRFDDVLDFSYPQLSLLMEAARARDASSELATFGAVNQAYCAARASRNGAANEYLGKLADVIERQATGAKNADNTDFINELRKAGVRTT